MFSVHDKGDEPGMIALPPNWKFQGVVLNAGLPKREKSLLPYGERVRVWSKCLTTFTLI
jgi:hypothetical protein